MSRKSDLVATMLRMRIARRFRKGLLKSRLEVELKFESLLTELGAQFTRQAIFIDLPKFYIVDFYIQSPVRMVIEIDGPHHQAKKESRLKDLHQEAFFESRQLRLVRFSNDEVQLRGDTVRNRLSDILKLAV